MERDPVVNPDIIQLSHDFRAAVLDGLKAAEQRNELLKRYRELLSPLEGHKIVASYRFDGLYTLDNYGQQLTYVDLGEPVSRERVSAIVGEVGGHAVMLRLLRASGDVHNVAEVISYEELRILEVGKKQV